MTVDKIKENSARNGKTFWKVEGTWNWGHKGSNLKRTDAWLP